MTYKNDNKSISQLVRNRLVFVSILAFIVSVFAFWYLHTEIANKNAEKVLAINLQDVYSDIMSHSNRTMVDLVESVANEVNNEDKLINSPAVIAYFQEYGLEGKTIQNFVEYLRLKYSLAEVNVVDKNGIIVNSTNSDNINYDMRTGEQSSAFMCLIDGEMEGFVQDFMQMSKDDSVRMKYAAYVLNDGGFVQIGYNEEQYYELIDKQVVAATENRHVGEKGSILIVRYNGDVVSSQFSSLEGKNLAELGYNMDSFEDIKPGTMFKDAVGGTESNLMFSSTGGYYIIGILPTNEAMMTRNVTLAMVAVLESIIFAILFILIYLITQKQIVSKIQDVANSLSEISSGNLDVSVDVKGNREFTALSSDINNTVSSLKQYIETEKTRLNDDLEYAKEIQHSSLPIVFPPFPNHKEFEIYATMDPAKEVGGDYYDFDIINGRFLIFSVADVSGKGIPAALFMMKAKTMVKSYANATVMIGELLKRVNDELCRNNEAGMFVTCWLGVLDTQTGIVAYVNAGHNPPLIKHADGKFEYLKSSKPNFVLGGIDSVTYDEHQFQLNSGDELFLYTDGVTEATNTENQLYGETRLKTFLNDNINLSCKNKCIELRKDIDEFVGEAPQFDDITMMSIKYKGFDNIYTTEAEQKNYDAIMGFIDEKLEKFGCPMPVNMKINVVADEIIANIMSYAYGSGTGPITVAVDKCEERDGVVLRFIDRGVPFNPLDREDPDTSLSAEERNLGGLGIFMIKKMMDKVEYEYSNSNNLIITKYF